MKTTRNFSRVSRSKSGDSNTGPKEYEATPRCSLKNNNSTSKWIKIRSNSINVEIRRSMTGEVSSQRI
jgi:hypothetical protein